MLNRLVASVVAFALAGLVTAGGAVCAGPGATNCCCELGGRPVSSPVMKMCCELVCGKKAGDAPATPADTSTALSPPDLPAVTVRVEPFDEAQAASVPVALKSVCSAVAKQDPPDLYLQKATFLI